MDPLTRIRTRGNAIQKAMFQGGIQASPWGMGLAVDPLEFGMEDAPVEMMDQSPRQPIAQTPWRYSSIFQRSQGDARRDMAKRAGLVPGSFDDMSRVGSRLSRQLGGPDGATTSQAVNQQAQGNDVPTLGGAMTPDTRRLWDIAESSYSDREPASPEYVPPYSTDEGIAPVDLSLGTQSGYVNEPNFVQRNEGPMLPRKAIIPLGEASKFDALFPDTVSGLDEIRGDYSPAALQQKAAMIAANPGFIRDFPEFTYSDDGQALVYNEPPAPRRLPSGSGPLGTQMPVTVAGVQYPNPEAARRATNRNLGFISVGNEPLSVDPMFDVQNSEEYGLPVETLDARRYGQAISKGQFDGRGNLYPTETVAQGNLPRDIADANNRADVDVATQTSRARIADVASKLAEYTQEATSKNFASYDKLIAETADKVGGERAASQAVAGLRTIQQLGSDGRLATVLQQSVSDTPAMARLILPILQIADPDMNSKDLAGAAAYSLFKSYADRERIPAEFVDSPEFEDALLAALELVYQNPEASRLPLKRLPETTLGF